MRLSFPLEVPKFMKGKILHEARGRLRVRLLCGRMSLHEADILEYYLLNVSGVRSVKV